jgi:hypothetical protein
MLVRTAAAAARRRRLLRRRVGAAAAAGGEALGAADLQGGGWREEAAQLVDGHGVGGEQRLCCDVIGSGHFRNVIPGAGCSI